MSIRVVFCSLVLALTCCRVWAVGESVCPGWNAADQAGKPNAYTAYASPYTYHWSDENKAQHRQVFALSLSRQLPAERFCGFSVFRNSFGQPSGYVFTGWNWPRPLDSMPHVYASVSAGIMYGYVGEFKDKVPLNFGGFSPVVVPSVGYRLTPRLGLEITILGTAAIMFGTSWRF